MGAVVTMGHYSRGTWRAFLTMSTLVWAGGTAVAAWARWDDARGGDARADVVAVQPNESHRRVYTATFVTDTGVRCRSEVNTGFESSEVAQPLVGEVVDVHYRRSRPCTLVRETGESDGTWSLVLMSVVLLVVLLVTIEVWLPPPPRVPRPWDEPELPRGTG